MITHILYQLMGKFGVASENFRKVLAAFISLMIFGLMYAVVRFTGMQIPNFTRNLVMLAAVDFAGFGFLMWKQKPSEKTQPVEEPIKEPVEEFVEEPVEEFVEEKLDERVEDRVEEEKVDENKEVERLMQEIIEENKEREKELEKEMGETES